MAQKLGALRQLCGSTPGWVSHRAVASEGWPGGPLWGSLQREPESPHNRSAGCPQSQRDPTWGRTSSLVMLASPEMEGTVQVSTGQGGTCPPVCPLLAAGWQGQVSVYPLSRWPFLQVLGGSAFVMRTVSLNFWLFLLLLSSCWCLPRCGSSTG